MEATLGYFWRSVNISDDKVTRGYYCLSRAIIDHLEKKNQ